MTNDATTNVGFKGPITSAQTPKILGQSSRYSIQGPGDLKVTAAAGTRTLSVAAGSAWGDGVLSTWTASSPLVGTAVASSGFRYDTVFIRRTWQPASSPTGKAEIILVPGSAQREIYARTTQAGVTGQTSDQPLALVRFDYNSNAVTEIVDLRCWGNDGGLYAASVEALQYLAEPGARVRIDRSDFVRVVDRNTGAVSWDGLDMAKMDLLSRQSGDARLVGFAGANSVGIDVGDGSLSYRTSAGTKVKFTPDGTMVSGQIPYARLTNEIGDSSFGSVLSGFAYVGGGMYRRGVEREMYLKIRTGSLRVVNSAGQIGDLALFTIADGDRPRDAIPVQVMYRGVYRPNKADAVAIGEQGTLVGGVAYVDPSGVVRFTFGSPSFDVLPFTASGVGSGVSFYIHGIWGAA